MKRLRVLWTVFMTTLGLVSLTGLTYANSINNSGTLGASDLSTSIASSPVADSYVNADYPNANYGSSGQLRVSGSPTVRSYLRFSVSGLSGSVTKATLRIYANNNSSAGYAVYQVSNNVWGESTIDYDNAPAIGGFVASSGPVAASHWTSADVTALINGNGTFSMALSSPNTTQLRLGSRESAHPPQLIIESSPTPASPTPVSAPPTATATATSVPSTVTRTATAAPLATATPTATSSPAATGTLVFSEEFNGTLDTTRWYHCYWWASTYCTSQPNNELELYSASNISVGNGLLDLRATRQTAPISYCDRNCQNYNYLSGLIQSGGTDTGVPSGFNFQYGYIEASVKIPSGQGLWPAFWLWPANYKDPPEIDIMENLGNDPTTVYMTYHSPTTGRHQCAYTGTDFSKDFHRFGVDWEAGQITWYVDGVARCNYSGPDVAAQPMYPILNLAVGGNWPGAPDASTVLPADYMVDYVRLYRC